MTVYATVDLHFDSIICHGIHDDPKGDDCFVSQGTLDSFTRNKN